MLPAPTCKPSRDVVVVEAHTESLGPKQASGFAFSFGGGFSRSVLELWASTGCRELLGVASSSPANFIMFCHALLQFGNALALLQTVCEAGLWFRVWAHRLIWKRRSLGGRHACGIPGQNGSSSFFVVTVVIGSSWWVGRHVRARP